MVKTFSERQEELSEERRDEDEEKAPKDEEFTQRSPYEFSGERVERLAEDYPMIAQAVPSDLRPPEVGDDIPQRVERRQEILVDLEDQFGVDLGSISQEIQNLTEVSLEELGQEGLLRVIARAGVLATQLMSVGMSTQVSKLEALLSIATAVEPGRLITVTGRNVIEQADTPEPVIPQSNNTDVPTRTVWIRADPQNQNNIAFGDDEIDPEDGFYLTPGESIVWELDFREDQLYMASEESGDAVRILGMI